jgi:hypothetical protein
VLGWAPSKGKERPLDRRARSREVVATSSEERQNEVAAGRRFYGIAGLTVQVESDLPITDTTFEPKFAVFEVTGPGPDTIVVRHHFGLPAVDESRLGREVYRRPPWVIYRSPDRITYFLSGPGHDERECVVLATPDHTTIEVFNSEWREEYFREGGLNALTMLPTDQIVLARVLAEHQACFVHSCGVIVDGRGLLLVGHSEAGKSTMMTMLASEGEALCDDRNIVRVWDDDIRVHGCWSHGEVPIVSAASAPLGAVLFLHKATTNRIVPLVKGEEILRHLVPCVIKPLVTADWWERTLDVVERITRDVPCYVVEFDRSGAVVPLLRDLMAGQAAAGQSASAGAGS